MEIDINVGTYFGTLYICQKLSGFRSCLILDAIQPETRIIILYTITKVLQEEI